MAPYSARILAAVDVPTIHFATGATHLLAELARSRGRRVGLDWRVPLGQGWQAVGHDRGVQGNLDPALLLGPFERVAAETDRILGRGQARLATSSISATACCPRPIRPCSDASESTCTNGQRLGNGHLVRAGGTTGENRRAGAGRSRPSCRRDQLGTRSVPSRFVSWQTRAPARATLEAGGGKGWPRGQRR